MAVKIHNTHYNINNKEVFIYELEHQSGCKATITNYGAIVLNFKVIKSNQQLQDIVLGFEAVEEYRNETYLENYPFFGAIIGRTGNRIKNAKFTLHEVEYLLANNLGNDNLHGGKEGFDKKVWQLIEQSTDAENPFIILQYSSPDGEEGFPGEVVTKVKYTLEYNELKTEITAITSSDTIYNPTQHTYFNLNENTTSIENHIVQLQATSYLEQDADFCPTGKIVDIKNTIYDFSIPKQIDKEWDVTLGYDQSFVVKNNEGLLQRVASCYTNDNNIELQVFSNMPIVHFYTGRWIPNVNGKSNVAYKAYSGLCFETQYHPDGINIPNFPKAILHSTEQYYQIICYKVFVKN